MRLSVAKEKSSYIVTIDFYDENDDAVIPDSIAWTLKDSAGSAVNSRTDIAIATPAATNDILLEGDDLPAGDLTFSVYAVVDLVGGNNKPVRDEVTIPVQNIKNV